MSYAEAAARGPRQSAEEVRHDPMPLPTSSSSSLELTLPRRRESASPPPQRASQFTAANHADSRWPSHRRAPPLPTLNQTESVESSSLIDVDSPHVSSVKSDFEAQAVQTQTQATRLEHETADRARAAAKKADEVAAHAKKSAAAKAKHAKAELKKDGKTLSDNRDNPVLLANAVLWSVGLVGLTVAAYRKHKEGQLDWKLAGSVAGVVGAFGVADYFASQWLLENKFPPK